MECLHPPTTTITISLPLDYWALNIYRRIQANRIQLSFSSIHLKLVGYSLGLLVQEGPNMEITIKNLIKVEAYLRSFAFLTLSLAAIVMATDRQTKIYFGAYKKTVDFRVATIFK